LPAEPALSEEQRVSRTTLRAALEQLDEEGLVYGIQDRGTFVSEVMRHYPLGYATAGADARATHSSHRVVGGEVEPAGKEMRLLFGFAAGSVVLRVRRLAAHIATALDSLVTPLAPALRRADFARSCLFDVLAEHGVKIARNRRAIESVIIDRDAARLLERRTGLPGISLTRLGLNPDDRVVAHVQITARGDIARYVIEFPVDAARPVRTDDLAQC
jgi:GntR family transcriptional regulator